MVVMPGWLVVSQTCRSAACSAERMCGSTRTVTAAVGLP